MAKFEEMAEAAKETIGQSIQDIGKEAGKKMGDVTAEVKGKAAEFLDKTELVKGPEVSEGGGFKAAFESFTERGKKTFESFTEKGKEFARGLFEKIKSSDVVQNIVDRYEIWRNAKLREQAEGHVFELNEKRLLEGKNAAAFEGAAEQTKASLEKIEALKKSMGEELDPEQRTSIEKEITTHRLRAEGFQKNAKELEHTIEETKSKTEEYEGKVTEARESIGGRLAEKITINNKTLEEYLGKKRDTEVKIKSVELQLKELGAPKAEFLKLFEVQPAKGAIAKVIKGELQKIEDKREELQTQKEGLLEKQQKLDPKIKKLQEKNEDLENKREKITGRKEEKLEEEEGKEEKGKKRRRKEGEMVKIEAEKGISAGLLTALWNRKMEEEGKRYLSLGINYSKSSIRIENPEDAENFLLTELDKMARIDKKVENRVKKFVREELYEELEKAA